MQEVKFLATHIKEMLVGQSPGLVRDDMNNHHILVEFVDCKSV